MLNINDITFPAKTKLSGFGLVELLVAVAILGVVLTFAIPSYRQWIENTRIRSVAESILNGVQQTRASAVTSNTQAILTLGANNSWAVACNPAAACTGVQYAASTDSVNITSTTTGGATVTFNSLGIGSGFTRVDVDSSVAAIGARPLRIEVSTSGSVRMCDPAFAIATTPRGCNP